MDIKQGNYYQKKGGEIVRVIKKDKNSFYLVYNLSNKKEEQLLIEKFPLIKLGITICRISELKEDNIISENIFKPFIDGINLRRSYALNIINLKYFLQLSNINEPNASDIEVDDDINDFFTKIESLKGSEFKLTTEQKDNFLSEQFM